MSSDPLADAPGLIPAPGTRVVVAGGCGGIGRAFAEIGTLWSSARYVPVKLIGYGREKARLEDLFCNMWDDIFDGTLRSACFVSREEIPLLWRGHLPAIVHTASKFGVRVA